MPAPAFPTELIIAIVADAINVGGTPTLQACSLVCPTWNAVCRPHIFHTVKIDTDARLSDLCTILSTDEAVQQFVRVLVVKPYTDGALIVSPWIEHLPRRLAPLLPRLSTIHLNDIFEFGDYINEACVADFALFTTVTELFMDNTVIAFENLVSVAAALPALQHVEFGFIRPMATWRPIPPQRYPPRLRTLGVDAGRIETKALDHIVEWFKKSPNPESLERLMLGTYLGTTVSTGKFLNELGPMLGELEWRLEIKLPAPTVIQFDISLRNLTALRSFTFRHMRGPVSRTILKFLEQLPRPGRLRRLALGVLTSSTGEGLPDFAPLAAYVHDGLEELCILHNATMDGDAVAAKLARDLPDAAARGILTTSCVRWQESRE